jgi:hypothetical protein
MSIVSVGLGVFKIRRRGNGDHGPESGAESFYRRGGSGWARIWSEREGRGKETVRRSR